VTGAKKFFSGGCPRGALAGRAHGGLFVDVFIKIYISIILYDRCKKIFFGGAPAGPLLAGPIAIFVGGVIKIYQ
jgi:hypothetical protein